jgi:hypothetical protein
MKIQLLSIFTIYLGIGNGKVVGTHPFAAAFTVPTIRKSSVGSSLLSSRIREPGGIVTSSNGRCSSFLCRPHGNERLPVFQSSIDTSSSSSTFAAAASRHTKSLQLGLFLDDNENESAKEETYFYPFSSRNDNAYRSVISPNDYPSKNSLENPLFMDKLTAPSSLTLLFTTLLLLPTSAAEAASLSRSQMVPISTGDFNPANFRPVCPASDGVYRFAQSATQNLVGPDNFVEYGPLIAGGLLRIRLELCVVESFSMRQLVHL